MFIFFFYEYDLYDGGGCWWECVYYFYDLFGYLLLYMEEEIFFNVGKEIEVRFF